MGIGARTRRQDGESQGALGAQRTVDIATASRTLKAAVTAAMTSVEASVTGKVASLNLSMHLLHNGKLADS
jgi:hypothetical protein